MTTRNFEALFSPRRIALIGASDRPGSVGEVLARNLLSAGFSGPIDLVRAKGGSVAGRQTVRTVAELPGAPDLAVIATPASTLPGLVSELGARGCRAAVVISAGFEGSDTESARLRQALLDAARPHLLRMVGPNCLGVLSPARGLNASFARAAPPAGGLALVAQSGAVAAAALDWAPAHGLGFSHVVTLGDALDIDVGDLLDFLGRDPETRAILLYVEAIGDARKFMSAARYAARSKPVIVLKGGRSAAGAQAAFSHTRALAGADAVYSAAFRRAGLLQVDGLDALLDTALLVAGGAAEPAPLALLTNGGGAAVLAVDALERAGGRLAVLSEATRAALSAVVPAHAAVGNPVDILGDAGPELYGRALETLLAAPDAPSVLVINCPVAVVDGAEAARAVTAAAAAHPRKAVSAAWLGEAGARAGRAVLADAGVPVFPSAEAAVRAHARLEDLGRSRAELMEAPDEGDGRGADVARPIIAQALSEGRSALAPLEVQAILAAYGVETPPARIAETPEAVREAAGDVAGGAQIVLKVQSPDISHKSDVGGVVLGLPSPDAAQDAARALLARVKAARPDARIDGILVQPMVARPRAVEILAGVVRDPTFGPVVVVGHGGVAVEVLADRALGLPPLNASLAQGMIARTRVSRLLAGFRDRPPADLGSLAQVLVALGQLALDLPEIAELDLNPVLCDASGALAVDARIAVRPPGPDTARPAIVPYPRQLARDLDLDGERLRLRPIRPTDRDGLIAMVAASTSEDVRLRFCAGMRTLSPDLATRLSQIDYDRHMALVAEDDAGELVGVGRLVQDPEGDTAEFALMVRSDRQRHGLGHVLLRALLDYAEARGLREVWGDVARENDRMRAVAADLGFKVRAHAGDLGRVDMVRTLRPR